jgi:hypothetical protein
MKRRNHYFSCLIFLSIICFQQLDASGFLAGTLVKVPRGYMPIEHLCIGDMVLAYDGIGLVEKPITQVIKNNL